MVGINSSGIACPAAEPKALIAAAFVQPADISRSGRITDTSEIVKEFAVRIRVMGADDLKSGFSWVLGLHILFFLTKNTMVASVKEKIYETNTATEAPTVP